MPSTILDDRGVVQVGGEAARDFLQSIVTCDISKVTATTAAFGALLTPQGKIIVDFIAFERRGGLLLDCPRLLADELVRRLKLYRLRNPIEIANRSDTLRLCVGWAEATPIAHSAPDPRDSGLGWRAVHPRDARLTFEAVKTEQYESLRITSAVPKGGLDFLYGETFPHEANMDRLHGVDFQKGCYIGQEVVSRVQHRGTARRRITRVSFDGLPPLPGMPILASGTEIGTIGSVDGGIALALLRLDKAAEAVAARVPLIAGRTIIVPHFQADDHG